VTMATSAEVVVRRAGEGDLETVVGVLHSANAEFENVLPPGFYRAYLANVLDVQSRLDTSELFVAGRADGHVVGAITLYPRAADEGWGWPAEWTGIRAVGVEPPARGLGVGRSLAEACIRRSRDLGAEAVCLHTASFMQAAMAMYESIGFYRVPEFDRDAGELVKATVDEPEVRALAYKLDLRGS
jgi:ribosomal protein S18 acetylase RimI-like enzyme